MFNFSGRCGRAEFFSNRLVAHVLLISALGGTYLLVIYSASESQDRGEFKERVAGLFCLLATVLYTAYQSAMIVRRLHDVERPGSHLFLLLVPFYNLYLWFYLCFVAGTAGLNRYGPDPLQQGLDEIDTVLSLACRHEVNGEWETAMRLYQEFVDQNPNHPECTYAKNCMETLENKMKLGRR